MSFPRPATVVLLGIACVVLAGGQALAQRMRPRPPVRTEPAAKDDDAAQPGSSAPKQAPGLETEVTRTIYPRKWPVPVDRTAPWRVEFEPFTPGTFPNKVPTTELLFPELAGHGMGHGERHLLISSPAGGMAVGSVVISGHGWKKETALNAISLKRGKAIAKKFPFLVKPLDVSPDGKLLAAACSFDEGAFPVENFLAILRIDDASFEPVNVFTPFDDLPYNAQRNEKVAVRCAKWLDENRLLISSSQACIVLLDVSTAKAVYGIKLDGFDNEFHLTPDKKYLTVSNMAYMAVFDAETGVQAGFVDAAAEAKSKGVQGAMSPRVAFSPNGRLFAVAGHADVHVWDFAKGTLLKSIPCQPPSGGTVVWINGRFLFTGGFLLDAKTGLECFEYKTGQSALRNFTSAAGQVLYVLDNQWFNPTRVALVAANPIPPNLEKMFEKVELNNERMMGPGDGVALKVDVRLGEGDKQKILEHFRQQIAANEWSLVQSGAAPYELSVVMGPPREEITLKLTQFGHSLPFDPGLAQSKFRPYSESVTVTKDGKAIWSRGRSVTPPSSYKSVADFEPAVREAMREKPDFFLKITLPKIITRGDAGSVRGTAQVTDSGFQFLD